MATAHIYLLRCWREEGQHQPPDEGWRFSIEDPRTGRRQGYTSLAAFTDGIGALVGIDAAAAEPLPQAARADQQRMADS